MIDLTYALFSARVWSMILPCILKIFFNISGVVPCSTPVPFSMSLDGNFLSIAELTFLIVVCYRRVHRVFCQSKML